MKCTHVIVEGVGSKKFNRFVRSLTSLLAPLLPNRAIYTKTAGNTLRIPVTIN